MVWKKLILLNMVMLFSPDINCNPLYMSSRAIVQNIRPLPCKGKNSLTKGVCMFALDCIKSNGTHLGTCIDRFYFGSCCDVPVTNKYTSSKPITVNSTIQIKTSTRPSTSVATKPVTVTVSVPLNTNRWETLSSSRPTSTSTLISDITSVSSKPQTLLPVWTTSPENPLSPEALTEITSNNVDAITETIQEDENKLQTSTIDDDDQSVTQTGQITSWTTHGNDISSASATSPNVIQSDGTETDDESTTFGDIVTTTEIFDINKLDEMDYEEVCGRQLYKARPTGRIVNGKKTQFGEWPWQISLRQWKRTTFMHKCGAALLNENWAITAAHCVDGVAPEDLLLRIGEFDLSSDSESLRHVERRVQIMTVHPDFNSRTFESDLALLRFYEPVKFQENIVPICLPTNDDNYVNKTGFVTGWGRLYVDGPLPNILQEVQVPIITNTQCEQEYRKAGFLESIPDIFLCAGYEDGGRDSCEGDSGGPLVIKQSDDRWFLAGIISWGIGCAEKNQPGVYSRITKFKDWINQILVF